MWEPRPWAPWVCGHAGRPEGSAVPLGRRGGWERKGSFLPDEKPDVLRCAPIVTLRRGGKKGGATQEKAVGGLALLIPRQQLKRTWKECELEEMILDLV